MKFHVMTLFPDLVRTVLSESIIGRAQKSGAIELETYQIRDYSEDKHHKVDDTPYGGGKGMLMAAPPICKCHDAITETLCGNVHTVYLSPRGALFRDSDAVRLAEYDHLILLCGHYEGVDERAIEEICDEELSIGDYVLTGGEIPACIVIDAVARKVPGVLSAPECHESESFASGLLEYPQYTKPAEYRGRQVPDILLSGNHAKIDAWRREQALKLTEERRPDLLKHDS